MMWSKIPFRDLCGYQDDIFNGKGTYIYKIQDKDLIYLVKKRICSYWKAKKLKFPFPNPVPIERSKVKYLLNYVGCVKMDGVRCVFYTTRVVINGNLENACFLVDQKFDVYIIDQHGLDFPGCETILDGELLGNKFYIHDIVVHNGLVTKNLVFKKRYGQMKLFMQCQKCLPEYDTIIFVLKRWYKTFEFDLLFQDMKMKNGDGIIFYPVDKPIGYGTDINLLKWKPRGKCTVDLTFQGGKFKAYDPGFRSYVTIETKVELNSIHLQEGDVVEFRILPGKVFEFVRIRHDKSKCNNVKAVEKTLKSVEENITREEILRYFT